MISIIIVNYNGDKFLKRLLSTIDKQTYRDFETILVDNGSTDSSIKLVQELFSWVRVVRSSNEGYGVACNKGAQVALGEQLIFLNEDMYMPIDFLEQMFEYRKSLAGGSYYKLGAIGCKMVDFDKDPDIVPKKFGGQIDLFGFSINKYYEDDVFSISGCPFFIDKKLFIKIRGFSEFIFIYGEDVDLSWRLRIMGYRNFMNHSTHMFHYGGGGYGQLHSTKSFAIDLCLLNTNN